MDFIMGLLRKSRQRDSIMVVVEKLTKVAHFILVKSTNLDSEVARVLIMEIVRLHGIPKKIVSNRDVKFTSELWKELFTVLGIELAFDKNYNS